MANNGFEIKSVEDFEFFAKYLLARQTGRENDLLDSLLGPGMLAGAWARAMATGVSPTPVPAQTASQATNGITG